VEKDYLCTRLGKAEAERSHSQPNFLSARLWNWTGILCERGTDKGRQGHFSPPGVKGAPLGKVSVRQSIREG